MHASATAKVERAISAVRGNERRVAVQVVDDGWQCGEGWELSEANYLQALLGNNFVVSNQYGSVSVRENTPQPVAPLCQVSESMARRLVEELIPEASVPGPTGPTPKRVTPERRWNSGTSAVSFLAIPEETFGYLETETDVDVSSAGWHPRGAGLHPTPMDSITLPAGTLIRSWPGGLFAWPSGEESGERIALRNSARTVNNIAANLIVGSNEE